MEIEISAENVSALNERLAAMPVITVPTETDVLVSNLREEIESLRQTESSLRAELSHITETRDNWRQMAAAVRDELDTARQNHAEDMHTVSEALHAVAERHEWCGEFEQFVARANRELHIEIEPRTRNYAATVTITLDILVNTNGSENAANEIASAARIIRDRAYHADGGYDFEIRSADVDDYDIEPEVVED